MAIDVEALLDAEAWKELPQALAKGLLRAGMGWRTMTIQELQGLEASAQQRGPGRPRKNGFVAPEGDLDRESAGDA